MSPETLFVSNPTLPSAKKARDGSISMSTSRQVKKPFFPSKTSSAYFEVVPPVFVLQMDVWPSLIRNLPTISKRSFVIATPIKSEASSVFAKVSKATSNPASLLGNALRNPRPLPASGQRILALCARDYAPTRSTAPFGFWSVPTPT